MKKRKTLVLNIKDGQISIEEFKSIFKKPKQLIKIKKKNVKTKIGEKVLW